MVAQAKIPLAIDVLPATAERWADLEMLFGKHGASAGCWCMFWRLERAAFMSLKGDGNKAALQSMVLKNQVPGLLAYVDGQAVGWCSVGPRQDFAALESSRMLKRVDDKPVWSIVCFFVAKPFRKQRVLGRLLAGALAYAREHGAEVVEGYPIDMQTYKLSGQKLTGYSGYMGIASVFRAQGFVQVGHASETQLIMRCELKAPSESK
jgi:GNAT superfamily N-acetyltransferase